jgi:ubiquitin carboxyl-terminal hydrolase 25/28
VSPTIELAKLALVTSKDEEEEDGDGDKGGTDSSNDTDATLVDDAAGPGAVRFTAAPESMEPASPTVLGKRSRMMDVDGAEKDYVIVSKPGSPNPKEAPRGDADGDIEMGDAGKVVKAVVPVRKSSESVMMFGAFSSFFKLRGFVDGVLSRETA